MERREFFARLFGLVVAPVAVAEAVEPKAPDAPVMRDLEEMHGHISNCGVVLAPETIDRIAALAARKVLDTPIRPFSFHFEPPEEKENIDG